MARAKKRARTEQATHCRVFFTDRRRLERARAAMPGEVLAEAIASAFKALSHPTRVRILRALSQGELCVCELSAVVGLSVSAISHQLSLLKARGLVKSRSDGKQVHYALGGGFVLALLEDCARHLSAQEAA